MVNPDSVQFGLDTFGDVQVDSEGQALSHAQTIRNIVEEAGLADELGIDFFGIGEHHRADYAVPAPDVLLAGIATQTRNIRLAPSVVVLGSDDPVRIFERYSSLNALAQGRAELAVGRGSFTESFPLFGYDFVDYEELFEEKLGLLRELLDADRAGEPVTWEGKTRASISGLQVFPPTETPLPAWVAVGGTPKSAIRAAEHGFNLEIAVITGNPMYFKTFAALYHRANEQLGNPRGMVSVHSPGLIAETDELARERLFEPWKEQQRLVGADRGWPAPTLGTFNVELGHGALYAGSPETVAQKIAGTIKNLDLDRFVLKYSNGPLQHAHAMESIRLYGERVIPRVRELLNN